MDLSSLSQFDEFLYKLVVTHLVIFLANVWEEDLLIFFIEILIELQIKSQYYPLSSTTKAACAHD